MFDYLQAACWSIVYILLIVYSIKFKNHGISLVAVCMNFSWETVALIDSVLRGSFAASLLIHIAWFSLDLIIILLFFLYETKFRENIKSKMIFVFGYMCTVTCCEVLFDMGYMLLLCFVIDLMMAVDFLRFVLFRDVKISIISYLIGIFKLFGDAFAWIFYRESFGIRAIGTCVFVCNMIYLVLLAYKKSDGPILSFGGK